MQFLRPKETIAFISTTYQSQAEDHCEGCTKEEASVSGSRPSKVFIGQLATTLGFRGQITALSLSSE